MPYAQRRHKVSVAEKRKATDSKRSVFTHVFVHVEKLLSLYELNSIHDAIYIPHAGTQM